jgi:hypothetical protein
MLYAKGGAAWAGDKYSADLPAIEGDGEAADIKGDVTLRRCWHHVMSSTDPKMRTALPGGST